MLKCEKCNISYNGNLNSCPLCNHPLVGEKTESVFPKLKKRRAKKIVEKILFFISFVVCCLSAFIECQVKGQIGEITTKIFLSVLTNYALIMFILNNSKHVLKMFNKYFWLILIILAVWYLYTKNLIFTTWIIPIICLIILIFNTFTIFIMGNKFIDRYPSIIFINMLIGLIPLILVKTSLTTNNLISYICALYDIFLFVGLLIFNREKIVEEIKKLLNA